MMDKVKVLREAKKRLNRVLALSLIFTLLLSAISASGFSAGANAETQAIKVSLTQTEPEGGFIMIPGASIPQDITVSLEKSAGDCFVYVKVTEKNNEGGYLKYQMAEGWSELLRPDGSQVPGVYYRHHESAEPASWPVLADKEIIVDPETATWSVLNALAEDATGESWPALTYDAYGFAQEESDGALSAYDGWRILNNEGWKVDYKLTEADQALASVLAVPEGLDLSAFDVHLIDENGTQIQPGGPVEVKLPAAAGAESALVLHVLDTHEKITEAVAAGRAVALHTADGYAAVVEVIEAEVMDGNAVFYATGFSTYYVVSGHGSNLINWWNTSVTRYNFNTEIYGLDANETDEREYVVEPDSTFYIYLDGVVDSSTGQSSGPVAGTWTVTSNNSDERIMISTAGDGLGKVITVSPNAQTTDVLTFKANDWAVTVKVKENIAADIYINAAYPVYIGITLNAIDISIGNEPRVSGYDNNNWVYVTALNGSEVTLSKSTGDYYQYNMIEPVAGSVGADYLNESITTADMLEGLDDKSVKGIIDLTLGTPGDGAQDIANYIKNIDWEAIKEQVLQEAQSPTKMATDKTSVTDNNMDSYVLQPYIIKIQTSEYAGWHINACFVPKETANEWIYFDENLNEDLGQRVEFLNVPARTPWNDGQGNIGKLFTVDPNATGGNYNEVSVSEYITLTNGQKLRFLGWNTKPDGTGDMFTNDSSMNGGVGNSKDNDSPLEPGGTLYAFWDSPLDRLEIRKELLIDEGQDTSGRYKTPFTFNVTFTVPEGMEIDTTAKIIYEEFLVADDSMVPNTKKEISLQEGKTEYSFSQAPAFNEDHYGVIYAPKGLKYEVIESPLTEYTLISSSNDTGTIEGVGEGKVVRFVNGWKNTTGVLEVSKTVQLEEGQVVDNWETTKFTFTVEMTPPEGVTDPKYTYQRYDASGSKFGDPITVEDTTITFELAHNESVQFTQVKEGTEYEVTETIPEGSPFAANENPITGRVEANKSVKAAFVNTVPETDGTLTITKEFDGCTPEAGESFVFTVTDADGAEVAEVVIYGAGSKTIALPHGTYTVAEDTSWAWRYEATAAPATTVTINSANPAQTITFTNTEDNGNWLDGSAGVTNDFSSGTATEHCVSNGGEQ